MKKNVQILILKIAFLLLLLAMFVLPLFSFAGYSLIENTLSDMGAQSAPNSRIINSVFLLLAAFTVYPGWFHFKGFLPQRTFLLLFSFSLALAAIFHQAPMNAGIAYNMVEDGWHKYFMTTTGLSFSMLSISTGLIPENYRQRTIALASGISVILTSIMISESSLLAGLWQRLMFIISFGWLLYNFKTGKTDQDT